MSFKAPRLYATLVAVAPALIVPSAALPATLPPPPPPLSDHFPREVEGYSTSEMNAAYQAWVGGQIFEAARIALDRAVPKNMTGSKGMAHYRFSDGPRLSARPAPGHGGDLYHFAFICPRPTQPTLHRKDEKVQAYLERISAECTWRVYWVEARDLILRDVEFEVQPDFEKLARHLREARVTDVWSTPDEVFMSLGDPMPALVAALDVQTATAKECPAILISLEAIEELALEIDIRNVGRDTQSVMPAHHPNIFKAELPIAHGGNGEGRIILSDFGLGMAYETWKIVDESVGRCFEQSDDA